MTRDDITTIGSGAILTTAGVMVILTMDHFLALLVPPAATLLMAGAWNNGVRKKPGFFLCTAVVAAMVALVDAAWLTQPLTVNPSRFGDHADPEKLERANLLLNLAFRLNLTFLTFYAGYYTVRALVHSRTAKQDDPAS